MNLYKISKNKGFGLIEVVVGTSLITVALIGLVSAYNLFLEAALKNTNIIQADFLVEEGLEALRIIRDDSWANNLASISSSTSYGLFLENASWQATTTISQIDSKFYRTFTVFDVYRDGNDDITLSAGNFDPDTKLFKVDVSWLEKDATTTRLLSIYLTKIF